MTQLTSQVAPDLASIESLATRALETIPPEVRAALGDVIIRVGDFCDEETERVMGLDSPFDLLGLYRGIDLPHRSVSDIRTEPDIIELYRRAILDCWCESGEDLFTVVRHVLIHEIGHHFGFSDDDMARIEATAPD